MRPLRRFILHPTDNIGQRHSTLLTGALVPVKAINAADYDFLIGLASSICTPMLCGKVAEK